MLGVCKGHVCVACLIGVYRGVSRCGRGVGEV